MEQAMIRQGALRGALVFAAWAGGLGYLVATGQGRLFLRPEFMWLLGLGGLIAFGFLVAVLRSPVCVPLARLGILVVPLLHIAASDPGVMSTDMMDKRFLGVQTAVQAPSAVRNSFTAVETVPELSSPAANATAQQMDRVSDDEISRGFAGEDANIAVTREPELTLIELLRTADRHLGSTVTLLGLLHRSPELEKNYGPGRAAVLYRFLVTCCAADALPVTVVLDGDVPAVAPEQWVEVTGVFSTERISKGPVPILTVRQVRLVDAPASPFLF